MTDGLLVVDKPQGITSAKAVAVVRGATGIKKAGHAGTLDPMATGVLVIGLNRATRLIRYVQDGEKEYVATIQFGVATDSLDADGLETERSPMNFSPEELRDVLENFRGNTSQLPPMVSAVKVGGKRLYELAREGKEVLREARQISISELELVEFDPQPDYPLATIRVVSSKGTYIRTLADDIARSLDGRAHLTALRRTRVGPFDLSSAIALEDLSEWSRSLLPPAQAVSELTPWLVAEGEREAIAHGRSLLAPAEGTAANLEVWAMLGSDNELLAVYRRLGERAVAEVVLA